MSDLFLQRLKVAFDAFQDFSGFAFAELSLKPPFWVFIVLAVIAAISAVAKRNHIVGNCTRTIVATERHPMVHGGSVKQPVKGAPTHGAFSIKVSECVQAILFCKIIRKTSDTGASNRTISSLVAPLIGPPFLIAVAILQIPPAKHLASMLPVFLPVLAQILFVTFPPPSGSLAADFSVVAPVLPDLGLYFLFILLIILFFVLPYTVGIIPCPAAGTRTRTRFAGRAPSVFLAFITMKFAKWFFCATGGAHFRLWGHWFFSYWSYLHRGCGQAVGLAFRAVHEATLAHSLIIPQGGIGA